MRADLDENSRFLSMRASSCNNKSLSKFYLNVPEFLDCHFDFSSFYKKLRLVISKEIRMERYE